MAQSCAKTDRQISLRKKLGGQLMIGAAVSILGAPTVSTAQDITVETDSTAPIVTSTADGGSPAATVTVGPEATITLPSGTGITVDSDTDVTLSGTLEFSQADDTVGVDLRTVTADYVQTGNINMVGTEEQLNENQPDFNDNRTGLRLEAGEVFTGNISLGDGAGRGSIVLQAENSTGIDIQGDVNGNVDLLTSSTVSVIGIGSTGVNIGGNIDGFLHVGGNIVMQADNPNANIDTANLSDEEAAAALAAELAAQILRQPSNALRITGDITRGVLIDGPPPLDAIPINVDGDPDNNVAVVGTPANLNVRGSASALYVGAANIGTITSSELDFSFDDLEENYGSYGLINRGNIATTGVYSSVETTAVTFDGSTIASGFRNDGLIQTQAVEADATGILISNATIPTFFNDGRVEVSITSVPRADAEEGETLPIIAPNGIGIDIAAGSNVPTLINEDTMTITVTSDNGSATLIRDRSNTLSNIRNTGSLAANIRNFDDNNPTTTNDEGTPQNRSFVLDASTNTTDLIFTNTVDDNFDPETDARTLSGLVFGDLSFGSGNDTFLSDAGLVTGNIDLGEGNNNVTFDLESAHLGEIRFGSGNNTLLIDGGAITSSDVFFGGGTNSLTLRNDSIFRGSLNNDGGTLDVLVDAAELRLTSDTATSISSLAFTDGSRISIGIADGGASAASLAVTGAATFNGTTTFTPVFEGGFTGDQTYTILNTGGLDLSNGTINVGAASSEDLPPFLFNFDVRQAADNANALELDVAFKTTDELGISPNIAAAYRPTILAINEDTALSSEILNLTSAEEFADAFGQLIAAPLDAPIAYSRVANNSINSIISERLKLARNSGEFQKTFWLQETTYFVNREDESAQGANGFDGGGWIIAGGADASFGPFDAIGIDVSAQSSKYDEQTGEDFPFSRFGLGVGAYGSMSFDKVRLDGNARYTTTTTESQRNFILGDVVRRTEAEWDGTELFGSVRATYDLGETAGYGFEPFVGIDHVTINEDAYTEEGGGAGIDLSVEDRESSSTRLNVGVDISKSFELKPNTFDTGIPAVIKPSLSLAWSQELGDEVLTSDVRYVSGTDSFTLLANQDQGLAVAAFNVGYENEYAKVHLGVNGAFGDVTQSIALVAGVGLKW